MKDKDLGRIIELGTSLRDELREILTGWSNLHNPSEKGAVMASSIVNGVLNFFCETALSVSMAAMDIADDEFISSMGVSVSSCLKEKIRQRNAAIEAMKANEDSIKDGIKDMLKELCSNNEKFSAAVNEAFQEVLSGKWSIH